MTDFRHKLYSKEELLNKRFKYIISIGKRQPMHIGHKQSLARILAIKEIGLIYLIGSSNLKGDPLFDPVTNPLTVEQQIEQFKLVFPNEEAIFIPIDDDHNISTWGDVINDALKNQNIKPEECVIHFIGKPEDKLQEEVRFTLKSGKEAIIKPGEWLIEALKYWGFYFWFDNAKDVNLNISARNIRKLDLEHLTKDQRELFAAPDYIIKIAKAARDANPENEKMKDIPVTMYDLSLQRMKEF